MFITLQEYVTSFKRETMLNTASIKRFYKDDHPHMYLDDIKETVRIEFIDGTYIHVVITMDELQMRMKSIGWR